MVRALLILAIALLYSTPSMAAEGDRAAADIQYGLFTQNETVSDRDELFYSTDTYGQYSNNTVGGGRKSIDYSTRQDATQPVAGVGMGVVPLFGQYGVVRAGGNNGNSTYVALGFPFDELNQDDDGNWDDTEERGFSYGIGVNRQSFNLEYMMSVDESNYGVSAVGFGITSSF